MKNEISAGSGVAVMSREPCPATLDDVDTPCLVVDLDVMEANIASMVGFCGEHGVGWRPHAKSFKSSAIGRKVVDSGAIGLTCAKLGEAEVMAGAGVRDLLIANPLVGKLKWNRLVRLAERADPIVVVDHADHVSGLAAAAAGVVRPIRVLIEVDIGMQRCGVQPGRAAIELAQQIAREPSLQWAGIMGWEGHLVAVADAAEKASRISAALNLLAETRRELDRAGFPCAIVSAGGTGSFQVTARMGVATEIQAGGGVFMDLFYRNKCHVVGLDYALTVLATVTSRPAADRAVMDAGRKTMNLELAVPEVVGRSDLRIRSLSAEHGVLDVLAQPGPAIGDRIRLVPGYGDFTTVLHDRIVACRTGAVEAIWPLDTRGRLE